MGCCSSPSLFLKEVSEALPWSAFGWVDHQVVPWNCVSCYHLKDLKVFICFVCSLLKGKSRSVLLLHQAECAVGSRGVLGGAENSQIKDVGRASKYLPDKSVTGIDCTGL